MAVIPIESIDAYEKLKRSGELGRLQARALRMVAEYPRRTSREYAELYGELYPNADHLATSIQPRISELERLGWIERVERRRCKKTNKAVGVFAIAKDKQEELFGET